MISQIVLSSAYSNECFDREGRFGYRLQHHYSPTLYTIKHFKVLEEAYDA